MRQASAVICGSRVQYWHSDQRSGDLLIALHGVGADHRGLDDLLSHVTGCAVVAPDLPGFGGSAPLRRPHTLENYAAFVDGLRRHLGADRIFLTGHSLGASIALVHAGRYPQTVAGLVLFNAVSEAQGATARLGKLYYDIGAWLRPPFDRWWLASKPAVWMTDRVVIRTKDRAHRRAILEYDYDTYRRADLRAIKECFLSYFQTPFSTYAGRITAPALFVTGERDQLAPPAAVAHLRAKTPDSALVVVEGAGHLFPAEQAAQAGAMLNRFLVRDAPRTGAPRQRPAPDPGTHADRLIDGGTLMR